MQVQTSGYAPVPVQTVAIMTPPPPPGSKLLRCLSIFHIIMGIIVMICGILANGMLDYHDPITRASTPMWAGCWVLVTGIIGIPYSRRGVFIAFNVVSSVIALATMLVFDILGLMYYSECWDDLDCSISDQDSGLGLYITLTVLMFIEFVVSIVTAAVYHPSCCCINQNQGDMRQLLLSASENPIFPPYYPTSTYPQHTGVMAYPGQIGGRYVTAQGQQMTAHTYSSQGTPQPPTVGVSHAAQRQQMPVQTYSSRAVSQQQPSGAYVAAQGRQMPGQTYSSQEVSQPQSSGGYIAAQGQQMPAQTYSRPAVSQPQSSGTYIAAQGQQMPAQTYSSREVSQPSAVQGQQVPGQTNIVYSAQSRDNAEE